MNRIICAVILAAALTACAEAQAQTSTNPRTEGDAKAGERLFMTDGCSECHGTVGQGGGVDGPRIAPMELSYDAFKQELRTPLSEMPPFEEAVVPETDASDIYAYLKSIPASRPFKDIPLLND